MFAHVGLVGSPKSLSQTRVCLRGSSPSNVVFQLRVHEKQKQAKISNPQLYSLKGTNNVTVTVWNSCVLSLAQIKLWYHRITESHNG